MVRSSPTLHLIRNNSRRFCVFVDSRLAEIHESSCVENCQYCLTKLNPSDMGTCLIVPKNHKKFLPWVEGPTYLLLPETDWPRMPIKGDQVKSSLALFITINEIKAESKIDLHNPFERFVAFVEHYSDFHCLIRSLCYIF